MSILAEAREIHESIMDAALDIRYDGFSYRRRDTEEQFSGLQRHTLGLP